MPLFQLRVSK